MNMRISDLLQIKKGVTSIIGGGGKTSLMLTLAKELQEKGTVIICTTTRIYKPSNITLIAPDSEEKIVAALAGERILCVSEGLYSNGKLTPPSLPISRLRDLADYVICEADGAKYLPLKAHASHEPVIPDESDQTILVIGIDGIGKAIKEVCHRPEIYSRLADVNEESVVTPEIAMKVVKLEGLGTRILINKVETDEQLEIARKMCELSLVPVVAGSLLKGEFECL